MLEFAAYAVHIDRHPDLSEIWFDRHKDPASMKAQREAFAHGRVLAAVTAANKLAGERFSILYQDAIDLGAHPNERAIRSNLEIVETAGGRTIFSIMQHEDGPAIDHVLRMVAQCGLVSMEMFQSVFGARFERLGVNTAMLDLWEGL
jgi:hypothetical protein